MLLFHKLKKQEKEREELFVAKAKTKCKFPILLQARDDYEHLWEGDQSHLGGKTLWYHKHLCGFLQTTSCSLGVANSKA